MVLRYKKTTQFTKSKILWKTVVQNHGIKDILKVAGKPRIREIIREIPRSLKIEYLMIFKN